MAAMTDRRASVGAHDDRGTLPGHSAPQSPGDVPFTLVCGLISVKCHEAPVNYGFLRPEADGEEMTMEMTHAANGPATPLTGPAFGQSATTSGMQAPAEYLIDAVQRGILFLDLLRQRGDQEVEITSRPLATVLRFDHEVLIDGLTLPRPINYSLLRIRPPAGTQTDPAKRPVVVVDPRAGQGPGIGGFKGESEIGDALAAGHTVYFVAFGATPAPGQTFLDVVEGQVSFFERVVALHPDALRPFAIGNCQAGYQTLMVAMLRPDLFGPCLVVGSPMSYWQGTHGKTPMRYTGGLLGGSWMTALASDFGAGRFDGTGLILNFDLLDPANWLWGKQYELYAKIDSDAQRYLAFEKWWGDFIQLNGDELQFLVDNLFIGDKLTRNALQSRDGTVFDLRNISSPIVVFTSEGDNISPPPQALGWILDEYRDVDDICAWDRTIVYCLAQEMGHLGLFVSSKVGAEQDEEFVQMIDVIDCLPPGLYEMVITPRGAEQPEGGFVTGDWISRFEARSFDDIRALGRNSPADDRAFAAAARLSEINLALYRTILQPLVRALSTEQSARLMRTLSPLRLSYTAFTDANPWMAGTKALAAQVSGNRRPAAAENPFLTMQERVSSQISEALDQYRILRDGLAERAFFGFYGAPLVQAMLGIGPETKVRPAPSTTPAKQAMLAEERVAQAAKAGAGGFDEALVRAVLFVAEADKSIEERSALALSWVRQKLMHLPLPAFKVMVRDQFFVLQLDGDGAVEALAALVPEREARKDLLGLVEAIAEAGAPLGAAMHERLERLRKVLPVAAPNARRAVVPAQPGAAGSGRKPKGAQ